MVRRVAAPEGSRYYNAPIVPGIIPGQVRRVPGRSTLDDPDPLLTPESPEGLRGVPQDRPGSDRTKVFGPASHPRNPIPPNMPNSRDWNQETFAQVRVLVESGGRTEQIAQMVLDLHAGLKFARKKAAGDDYWAEQVDQFEAAIRMFRAKFVGRR